MKPRIVEFPNDQSEVTESRLIRQTRFKEGEASFWQDTKDYLKVVFLVALLVLGMAAGICELIEIYDEMEIFNGK